MSHAIVEALRAQIQARAPFLEPSPGAVSGVPDLDELIHGLPLGAVTVLSGPLGTGGSRIAARVLATGARAGAPVAWIDGAGTLHPPALAQEGLELRRLLVVQRRDARVVQAFEQILGSGLFAAAVATGIAPWLSPVRMRRIQQAAEVGRRVALLVLPPPEARAFTGAALRLGLRGHAPTGEIAVEVEKDRRGRSPGQTGRIALSAGGG